MIFTEYLDVNIQTREKPGQVLCGSMPAESLAALPPVEFVAVPFLGACQPLSAVLHLGGAIVYGALTASLLRRARAHTGRFVSLAVFAVSCVSLLAISGLYHWTDLADPWREPLQRLDHAAIFVLIAGTLTPFHVLVFRGSFRWVMLGIGWSMAIAAIVAKLLFFDALGGGAGLALYVSVGSVAFFSVCLLPRRVRLRALVPFAAGAAAYVGGALLEVNDLPVLIEGVAGPHEFFHASVLLGTALHWRFLSGVGESG